MSLNRAILQTLSYHDIFSFPLTRNETHLYLIDKLVSKSQVDIALNKLVNQKLIFKIDKYYFLKGRQNLVKLRIERLNHSKKKILLAAKYANILKNIPTIKYIGVSGALAMNNSKRDDDIDLFIISSKGNLWTTRLVSSLFMHPYRRRVNSKITKDKVCLNMFLDTTALSISEKNLYIAHEVAQLRTIWDREKTYELYIQKNSWIRKYLPNWEINKNYERLKSKTISLKYMEPLLRNIQISYMRSKITTEHIGNRQILFHPKNIQRQILLKYRAKIHNIK